LPDAKNLTSSKHIKVKQSKTSNLDLETQLLLSDLIIGTTSYSRSILSGGSLPTKAAIKEARQICDEATKITNSLDEKKWSEHKELKQLTRIIYSRIPKKVTDSRQVILTPTTVQEWINDLDAFESISTNKPVEIENIQLAELNMRKLKFVPKDSEKGSWIYNWLPNATRNRHSYLQGKFQIKNLWFVERVGDVDKLTNYQIKIGECKKTNLDKVLHQPNRKDTFNKDLYNKTNTVFLIHGTRSVNVKSILQQSFLLPKNLNRSQITGAAFGSGVYCADDYKKSIGYTSQKGSYWSNGSGGISNRNPFLFLCDVTLGNPHMVSRSGSPTLKKDEHSVFAESGVSFVQNNEYVIFDTNAIRIRYLVEFDI